ncbi:MAG: transporter substrate-binding domain-containing protein [Gemmatimonadaceae bacterium]
MHDWICARVGACTALIAAVTAVGCGVPRDSDRTLERVRGSELRVGVTDHPPWVEVNDHLVSGVEPALVSELARRLRTRAAFHRGSESELLEALRRGDLDLVAAGLDDRSPWKGRVALTRPYLTDATTGAKHVLAVRSGENAWLVHVETFLASHPEIGAPTNTAER